MRGAARASLVVTLALLVTSKLASADPRSLVTLVRPAGKDATIAEATTRLKAEIETAGFRVRVVEAAAGNDARAQVEESIAPECAGATPPCEASFATIAIVPTGKGAAADVWVADHVTKKTSVRRIDVAAGSATLASDLAVRAVELLRASLLEANGSAARAGLPADVAQWIAPSEAKPSAPPIVLPPPEETSNGTTTRNVEAPALLAQDAPPPAPARKPGFFVSVAGAIVASSDVGATFTPVIRAGLTTRAPIAFRLSIAPSMNATLSYPEGTIRVRQDLVTADLVTTFGLDAAAVRPLFAIGAGLHHAHVEGDARPPFTSESNDGFSFALTAGSGFVVLVTGPLTLVGEGDLVLLSPARKIAVAGDDRAELGRPSYLGSLGLALAL